MDCDVSTCFLRSRLVSSDATPGLKNSGVGFVDAPDPDPDPGPRPDPEPSSDPGRPSLVAILASRFLSAGSVFGKDSGGFEEAVWLWFTRTPLTFSLLRGESPQVERDCWASV